MPRSVQSLLIRLALIVATQAHLLNHLQIAESLCPDRAKRVAGRPLNLGMFLRTRTREWIRRAPELVRTSGCNRGSASRYAGGQGCLPFGSTARASPAAFVLPL